MTQSQIEEKIVRLLQRKQPRVFNDICCYISASKGDIAEGIKGLKTAGKIKTNDSVPRKFYLT